MGRGGSLARGISAPYGRRGETGCRRGSWRSCRTRPTGTAGQHGDRREASASRGGGGRSGSRWLRSRCTARVRTREGGSRRRGVPEVPAPSGTAVARTKRTTARRRSLRTRTAVEARTCAGRGCWSVELVPDRRDVTRRRIPAPAGRCQASHRKQAAKRACHPGSPARRGNPSGTSAAPRGPPSRGTVPGESWKRPREPFWNFRRRPKATAGRASVPDWFPRACGNQRPASAEPIASESSERTSSRCLLETQGLAERRIRWSTRDNPDAREARGQPRLGRSAGVASGPRRLRAQRTRRSAATARTGRCRVAPRRLWGSVGPSGACCLLSSLAAAPRRPAPAGAARPTSPGAPGTAPRSTRTSRRRPRPTPARR